MTPRSRTRCRFALGEDALWQRSYHLAADAASLGSLSPQAEEAYSSEADFDRDMPASLPCGGRRLPGVELNKMRPFLPSLDVTDHCSADPKFLPNNFLCLIGLICQLSDLDDISFS